MTLTHEQKWDRFWAEVDVGLCWEWTRSITYYGYGQATFGGLAHRWSWTWLVGTIPEGMVLDHLCRNRRCVNPDHMELVTLAENKRRGYSRNAINARKTHCPANHEYTQENTILRRGTRECRTCVKARSAAAYRRRREAAHN